MIIIIQISHIIMSDKMSIQNTILSEETYQRVDQNIDDPNAVYVEFNPEQALVKLKSLDQLKYPEKQLLVQKQTILHKTFIRTSEYNWERRSIGFTRNIQNIRNTIQ